MLVYNVRLSLFNLVLMDNKTVFYFSSSGVETVVKMVFGLLKTSEKQKQPQIAKLHNIFVVEDFKEKSVFEIQHELEQLGLEASAGRLVDAAPVVGQPQQQPPGSCTPDTPQPQYNKFSSLVSGCLRPFWSIIGKASAYEIRENQDDWEIPFENIRGLEYLGCGSQGTVYSGTLNNEPVAVKKVNNIKETDIRNLRKLNHPNVIKFKGVCTQEPCYSIIMEFCPYGPLSGVLKDQKNVVTPARVARWSQEIAKGMCYLHEHKIIHRDLKSPNVLIGDNEVVKISDFGTCRTWNGERSEKMSFAGTVAWMAPEVIKGSPCSEKVDVWAYGIVLWELLTCEVPYNGMETNAIMYLVGSGKLQPPVPSSCPEGYKLVMAICWRTDARYRPSFKMLCSHLELASTEILSSYKDDELYKTQQENWREEIKTQIIQHREDLARCRMEFQLKEEQALKRREMELKDIGDISELYKRKVEKVEMLHTELISMLQQLDQVMKGCPKKREFYNKRRMINKVMKKINKSKPGGCSTTPTSPERSTTSPDSPPVQVITKAPLYVRLNPSTKPTPVISTTTQTSVKPYRKHYRTSSTGSPRNSSIRSYCSRRSTYVNAETQTEMEVSETDLSPTTSHSSTATLPRKQPQNVVLVQEEGSNGNRAIELHFFPQHNDSGILVGSRSTSPTSFLQEDLNRNDVLTRDSDEDNLDAIGSILHSVRALKNGNIFSDMRLPPENGNCTESRTHSVGDSAEDAANDDSYTDEEGEVCNHSLRRRSFARRPIYPRRPNRYQKSNFTSDEGNTSEYSVSPSSKNSTLESNPDRTRSKSNLALKRPNERSDGSYSSDSESEENTTVTTQIAFNMNKTESEVWNA